MAANKKTIEAGKKVATAQVASMLQLDDMIPELIDLVWQAGRSCHSGRG